MKYCSGGIDNAVHLTLLQSALMTYWGFFTHNASFGVRIIPENQVNTMVADVLGPCIARLSAAVWYWI